VGVRPRPLRAWSNVQCHNDYGERRTDLLNGEGLAEEVLSVQSCNRSISLCRALHGHETESARLIGMGIAHDLGLLNLFVVLVKSRHAEVTIPYPTDRGEVVFEIPAVDAVA